MTTVHPPPATATATATASGSAKGKESSRSSRRRMGSTGAPVVLGGGVGAIGKATEMGVQNLDPYTTLYNRPSHLTSPTSPLFPQRAPSPSFASSSMSQPAQPSVARSRSPIPSPPAVAVAVLIPSVPAQVKDIQRQAQAGSSASLSTTASTSSRTLKTPQAKGEHYTPIIASGSGSLDSGSPVPQYSHRAKQSSVPKSPTPLRSPVPPMAQGPLPPTPAESTVQGSRKASSSRSKPAPLALAKKENRLSQDWVQIAPPSDQRAKSTSSLLPEERPVASRNPPQRLPVAQMIPMKKGALSPERPRFERMSSAPLASPTYREAKQGRASLDHLRSVSPSPAPRQSSHSTPPAAILDAMRAASAKSAERPDLRTRRSEDLLRPSMESAPSKKEIRAMQQRALGVASTAASPPLESERKTSGISLKKSSGALKALFIRGASGKGREKEKEKMDTTPPVPSRRSGDELRRPSGDELPRPSLGQRPTPSPVQRDASPSGQHQTRSSFSVERRLYPAAPQLQRAASAGASPLLDVKQGPRPRIPSRDLPALPPPTPSPASVQSEVSPATPLAESLPTSSLPYLSAMANRASVVSASAASPNPQDQDVPSETISASSSGSTTRAGDPSPLGFSPIKPSKSLHLLQLPELDLDFNVSFDRFSASPATPRRSPRRSPRSPGDPSPKASPVRAFSTRSPRVKPAPPVLQRTVSERRRSQSFDGPTGSLQLGEDMWKSPSDMGMGDFISPSVAEFFASASSSSVPTFSPTLHSPEMEMGTQSPILQTAAAAPASESSHSHSHSMSSQPSSERARTPSNASSTNETPSPSPPHTPEDRTLSGLGFGNFSPSTTSSTPTPTAAHVQEAVLAKKPFMLNEVPNIPLPALPSSSSLAPPAVIERPKEKEEVKVELRKPRDRVKTLQSKSRAVIPDSALSTKGLARELERLLYAQNATSSDRATMLRNDLLTLMVEVDKRSYDPRNEGAYMLLRETCFHWADTLLFELRIEQPANERGACLEGLSAVVECAALSERALQYSPPHQAKFKSMMIKCMTFVMSKLGAKGVFHNTLLFSGRFLAFAFFRVPHVGEQLVTVLQPPKGAMMRFTRTIMLGAKDSPVKADYPAHLLPLCFDNSRAYAARLASLSAEFGTEEERDAFLFQPGNWLRRWQSDDSELFPAFYRAYHRQLAQYLSPVVKHYEGLDLPVPAAVLMRAPGYAHLATVFANKCHSYILGSVNAVTTSSSASNFEATETAGFRGSQKPPVLETANRRLVETISTFANLKVMIPSEQGVIECDGSQLWTDMIDVWTKNLISKTSLYAPKGVFSLFDLLDGIVDPPFDAFSPASTPGLALDTPAATQASLLDVPHLIYVIRLILTQGEHALTLVKAIAFVFTHWEALTARADDRRELCLELLLEKELFERLLLFWSQSVRSYVLRLVVFRLGHLHTSMTDGAAHDVEIESVRLLQKRLDGIKKRHDELEPKGSQAASIDERESKDDVPATPTEGGFSMPRSRSTITMVADSPHTGSANKAERLLGLGFGITEPKNDVETDGSPTSLNLGATKMGKATNWFKKSFGKKRKDSHSPGPSPSLSPNFGTSPIPASDDSSSSGSPGQSPINRQSGSGKMPDALPVPGPGPGPAAPSLPIPRRDTFGLPPALVSPSLDSPTSTSSTTSDKDREREGGRKSKPSVILTTAPLIDEPDESHSHSQRGREPLSPNSFKFEFGLPTMSPRSDTFDPTPSPASAKPSSSPSPSPLMGAPSSPSAAGTGKRNSAPPSPRQPPSPHMSRSFSKRSSLLPPSTASALEGLMEKKRLSGTPLPNPKEQEKEKEEKGYEKKLHPYAIRMLAELEDAQKEYDEWWSDTGVGRLDGAPPRLTVAWPFHEGEE